MVDTCAGERTRLRWLSLDFDSFFASVEQTERPELRGRPVGVAPLLSEATCVIAASYEARRYGIRCGTLVAEARRLCPEIAIVGATPGLYTAYRRRVDEVLDAVLPIPTESTYIDELQIRLLGEETRPARARELALEMKRILRGEFGPVLTASVGFAPNPFLAKVAAEMGKPNGLTLLPGDGLPGSLFALELRDLPGINRRMEARFNARGIFSVRQLCEGGPLRAREGAGSVLGERWWRLLHGEELSERPTRTKTLGHSHVLGGEWRNREGVKAVLLRLLGKALARLRADGWFATGVHLGVHGAESWQDYARLDPTCDDRPLVRHVVSRLATAEYARPKKVSVTFDGLLRYDERTGSLFDEGENDALRFGAALDGVNRRFGKHKVHLASVQVARETGDEKIAFGKTTLFSEGAGDHVPATPPAFFREEADPFADELRRREAFSEASRRAFAGEGDAFWEGEE